MVRRRFRTILLGMLAVNMLLGFGMPYQKVHAAEYIKIDEEKFPDLQFRKYVSEEVDGNSNGVLSKKELKECSYIDVSNMGVSDLTGVEHFVNLTGLYCADNKLTVLDVSRNINITDLVCENNLLHELDLGYNTQLGLLCCGGNQLTDLYLSKNQELYYLDCKGNSLQELNFRNNDSMEYLFCDNNVKISCSSKYLKTFYYTDNKMVRILDKESKGEFRVLSNEKRTIEYVGTTSKTAKKIKIPAFIDITDEEYYKVVSIGKDTFKDNQKIQKVTIGGYVKKIGSSAFSGCKQLKKVVMGDEVSYIGDRAFYKCTKLQKITLPSKIKKIGKQSFYGCKNLKSITIKTTKLTKKNVGSKAFKGIYAKASIKVPEKKFLAYKKLLKAKGASKKVKIKK